MPSTSKSPPEVVSFLSSNAQDFIEESIVVPSLRTRLRFLSSNAQDFIEETQIKYEHLRRLRIPEQ